MKHIQTTYCNLDIIDLYILDSIVNIDRIASACEKNNILIPSMPTKVHDEQCLSSPIH
jgi:hypothetical protein